MTERINALLESFPPIRLEDMDRVRLMDRTDRKFLLNLEDLPEFLEGIKGDYQLLKIKGKHLLNYQTQYLDTKELSLYHLHQTGRSVRWKIRHRVYVDSGVGFFEVKTKNNKGRTIKSRVPASLQQDKMSVESEKLIMRLTPVDPGKLIPAVDIGYKRVTFVNQKVSERITIDLDLHLSTPEIAKHFNDLVIIEVKQESKTDTKAILALRNMRLKEGGISKYCLAITQLYKDVKKNNFKPALIRIYKLLHETPAA